MSYIAPEKHLAAHKVLAELDYELRPVERGYANRTLYVNCGYSSIVEKPVSQQMKRYLQWARVSVCGCFGMA